MPPKSKAASTRVARATKTAESAKDTKSRTRSTTATAQDDLEYLPTQKPQTRLKLNPSKASLSEKSVNQAKQHSQLESNCDDSASSSSSSTIPCDTFIKREARPTNLKEESSSDESVVSVKRPASRGKEDRAPAAKRVRREAHATTPDTLGSGITLITKGYKEKEKQLHEAQQAIASLESKLAEKDREASTAKNEVAVVKEQAKEDALNAKEEINTLEGKLERARLHISELNRKFCNAQQSNSTRRDDEFQDIRERKKALEVALKESQQQCEKAQAKVRELAAELLERDNEQNEDLDYVNNKVTDDDIEKRWAQLCYSIRQLASQTQMPKHESAEELSQEDLPHYEEVMLLLDSIKETPSGKSLFVQRFIWTRIYKGIFLGTRKTWGGLVGTRFMHFIQFLQDNEYGLDEAEDFSFVKGRAASLLDKIFEKYKNDDLDGMCTALAEDLAILVPAGAEGDFDTQMIDILTKAHELNRIFVLSRAFFIPSLVEPGTEVDEDKMDICYYHLKHPDGNESLELDLIISPMVEKIGSADGWDFHKRWAICKAVVTVK